MKNTKKYTKEDLKESFEINRSTLRKLILRENVLDYKCQECGLNEEWNGKEIILEIDHINGNRVDNRIENLRFLCPNCHSQTSTFKGRNKRTEKEIKQIKEKIKIERRNKRKKNKCSECGQNCTESSDLCRKCYKLNMRKYERPDIQILLEQVKKYGYTHTGRIYGVSDNTIRNWIYAEIAKR